jgi:hypothetical protein
MFDFCKPRKKKIVWYPKHRYYDELGLYDKKKQESDMKRLLTQEGGVLDE